MQAHIAIVDLIEKANVDTVFTLASEEIIPLLSEIEDNRDEAIQVVHCRHEQGAAAMADGYARTSEEIGVCIVGRGPAIAQTGTALRTAAVYGSRVLYLVPESRLTSAHDGKGFQQEEFLNTMMGDVVSIRSPEILLSSLVDAIRRLRSGEGPIAVQIPTDVLESEISDTSYSLSAISGRDGQDARLHPDAAKIDQAIDTYLDSDAMKAPVIIAGRGAIEAGARDAIEQLAERMNAYLATSLLAKGYFADHPYYLGPAGDLGQNVANEYITESGFLLAFGASLNHHTVDSGALIREDANVVHVDTDPGQIGQYVKPDVGIVGDAKITAERLNDELREIGIDRAGEFWTDRVRTEIEESSSTSDRSFEDQPGTIDPRVLIRSLDDVLPEDRLIITDVGHFLGWVFDGLKYRENDRQIWAVDFLALGMGLPIGIGAAIGEEERTSIVISGDGGLMMSLQELETAARNDVPMIVVVINDDAMGAEYHMGQIRGFSGSAGDIPSPDFAPLANEFGAVGHTIRSVADIEDLESVITDDLTGPLVLDCKVNPNVIHRALGNMAID